MYLDIDIIIKDDIHKVFQVCNQDILYALEEGEICSETDNWGLSLFGDEINQYLDKSAFSSGILLFHNSKKMEFLFQKIKEDIINRYHGFYDQPYIVYNAFKYQLYDNKILKTLAINNNFDIYSDKVIHHFPGGPFNFEIKLYIMNNFLYNIKKMKKYYIIKSNMKKIFVKLSNS